MKNIKITVIRKARYDDLIEKYENPIEHACDMEEGQVFICNGWQKPEGFCESAWESVSPFVKQAIICSIAVVFPSPGSACKIVTFRKGISG